jgi:ribosomal protein S18 acetylase RimI-like enzyme
MKLLAQLLFTIRKEGFGAMGTHLAARVKGQHLAAYGRLLTGAGPSCLIPPGVVVRRIDSTELRRLDPGGSLPSLAYRRQPPPFLWVALIQGRPAGLVWGVTDYAPIRLNDRDAALVALETRPADRRKGIALALVSRACDDLMEAGYRRAYATIDPGNRASRSVFERAGFLLLGYQTYRWPWPGSNLTRTLDARGNN